MKVSSDKRQTKFDFTGETGDDAELRGDGSEINLTNASLRNTKVKKVQKTTLPMSDIISGILDKDLSSRQYKVL